MGAAVDFGEAAEAGLEDQVLVVDRDRHLVHRGERLGLAGLRILLRGDVAAGLVREFGRDLLAILGRHLGDVALEGDLRGAVNLDPGGRLFFLLGVDQDEVGLVDDQVSFELGRVADLAEGLARLDPLPLGLGVRHADRLAGAGGVEAEAVELFLDLVQGGLEIPPRKS